MKITIYSFLLLTLFSCLNEFVLRPNIKGFVYDVNNNPINNAKVIFIDCLNSTCNNELPTFTDKKGQFIINKEIKKYIFIKPNKYNRPYYSYMLTISKDGYLSDTLDIREYDKKSNFVFLDTIKLKLTNITVSNNDYK